MGYKWKIAQFLDRPGGRFVLGRMATVVGRRITGLDVNIAYANGRWTRRTGADVVPGGPRFDYDYPSFHRWIDQCASQTRDYWFHVYEPKPGDTIIDAGAGQGEDTLTFSRAVGATGHVIAIEAHPLSFKALENFCRRNRLRNVTPIHLALLDKPGKVSISEGENWTQNAVISNGNVNGAAATSVPAGTLDDVCQSEGVQSIALVKMNIEGAERLALLGAEKTMSHVQHICVATHDFRTGWGHDGCFCTRRLVEAFLSEKGFTITSRPDDPRAWVRDHIYGERPR